MFAIITLVVASVALIASVTSIILAILVSKRAAKLEESDLVSWKELNEWMHENYTPDFCLVDKFAAKDAFQAVAARVDNLELKAPPTDYVKKSELDLGLRAVEKKIGSGGITPELVGFLSELYRLATPERDGLTQQYETIQRQLSECRDQVEPYRQAVKSAKRKLDATTPMSEDPSEEELEQEVQRYFAEVGLTAKAGLKAKAKAMAEYEEEVRPQRLAERRQAEEALSRAKSDLSRAEAKYSGEEFERELDRIDAQLKTYAQMEGYLTALEQSAGAAQAPQPAVSKRPTPPSKAAPPPFPKPAAVPKIDPPASPAPSDPPDPNAVTGDEADRLAESVPPDGPSSVEASLAYITGNPPPAQPKLPPVENKRFCTKCGAAAKSGEKFCGKCGTQLP